MKLLRLGPLTPGETVMFGNVWKSYVNDVVSSSLPISSNSIQYSLIVYGLYIIYSLYLCNN